MSFASEVKAEMCRTHINKRCCAVAESCGVLMFCNRFSVGGVRIATSSPDFAARLPVLFKKAFNVTFDAAPRSDMPGRAVFEITKRDKLARIFETYGYDLTRSFAHHVNFGVLEEECDRVSFLRGAFFAGGSVTAPDKRYHLELVTDHFNVSRETMALLLELGFEPKMTSRGGNYIIYFKHSVAIEDFLTTVGAPVKAMDIMSAKVDREMTNKVQRQVNCDTANAVKTVAAAAAQLDAIRTIRDTRGLSWLPDKLRGTAELRLENPEMSIAQLAEACDPPVTKSCLSHRLRRITELAKDSE